MFSRMPERSIALTLLWIWLGIVAAVVIGWWLHKKFRTPEPPPELPYAQGLKDRLKRSGGGKRVRHRDSSRKRHHR